MSSISLVRSVCRAVRLLQRYEPVVQSYQLVLKLADILEEKRRKEVNMF